MLPAEYSVKRVSDSEAQVEFRLDPGMVYFKGHFPGRPVLPGVAQLGLACGLCEEIFKTAVPFREVPQAKFLKPMQPSDEIVLALSYDRSSGQADFAYYIKAAQAPDCTLSQGKAPEGYTLASRGRLRTAG